MKIAMEGLFEPIIIEEGSTVSLCIENQKLFRTVVEDIHLQMSGQGGLLVFSLNDALIKPQNKIVIMDQFAPFEINTKDIKNGLCTALEKEAMSEEHYNETMKLLTDIELYFDKLSNSNYNMVLSKLNVNSIIKGLSPMLVEDYESPMEAMLDYMDHMTEFLGEKLFVAINLRSYFLDEELVGIVETIKAKGMRLFLLESLERDKIDGIKTLVIDNDLCQI